jgi:hypothetical protein
MAETLTVTETIALRSLVEGTGWWTQFKTKLEENDFSFKCAVELLQDWADFECPHSLADLPYSLGVLLERLFAALTVDPVLTQMYCLCSKSPPMFWKNVFEFYAAMHKMHNILTCGDYRKPLVRDYMHYCIYGVNVVDFPLDWCDETTRKFCWIAQKEH